MNVKISTLVAWALLLVLGQLLITQWTVEAAGNQDVIDYISFAGTVVGMVLAILAIVYSYLSTAAQRNDAESIKTQVARLNDAIMRANESGSQFAGELSRLEEIREGLARISDKSDRSLAASERIEELVTRAQSQDEASKRAATGVADEGLDVNRIAVASVLAKKALPIQVVLFYLALHDDDDDANQQRDKLLRPLVKEGFESFWSARFSGEIIAYYLVLLDFGVPQMEGETVAFKAALLARARRLLEGEINHRVYDPRSLRSAIEDVVKALADEVE